MHPPNPAVMPPHPASPATAEAAETASAMSSFFPVPIDALNTRELELDLYLIHAGAKPVLYRSVGSAYSMADCDKLVEQGITHLYVPTGQHTAFRRLMTDRLVQAYEDPSLGRAERCRIVRASCGKMIEDLMSFPQIDGIAETIGAMAERFSAWCTGDEDKFGYLLDMSEHDFYTATHMVNVGVGCGMLCAEPLGPDNDLMREIVQGGLIHDIGKRGVPGEILNKEGKLTEDEWVQIRTHPLIGAQILSTQSGVGEIAMAMTRDHHERLDGRGYPNGIACADISLPARICAVVDIYDAMASARPYRGPIPPTRVLDSLREEAGTVLDKSVFEAWERVIRRQIERDPSRCVPDRPDATTPSLRAMMPSAPKQTVTAAEPARAVPSVERAGAGVLDLDDEMSACDVAGSLAFAGAPDAERTPIRIVGIGPRGLRLEIAAGVKTRPAMRVIIEGRPPIEVEPGRRSVGPLGETIVDCSFVRTRKAG